jgi:ATP/maltotriose-dependent transcriptional regulator MalT
MTTHHLAATTEQQPPARRIIDRPRLLKQLDDTDTRIILLIAPAGYGKTTLVRQWAERRTTAWYRATTSSADVAVTAVGLAEAASTVIEDVSGPIAARVAAARHPETEAAAVGEVAAQQFAEWPADAWMVIDDAHFVSSPAAAAFLEPVIDHSPLNLVVISRRRPTWLPIRRTVYGEIFELHQRDLAFTLDESRAVFTRPPSPTAVVDVHNRAEGWPAVLGLAAANPVFRLPEGRLQSPLYDYFADELVLATDAVTARRLMDLAIVPTLRPEIVEQLIPDPGDLLDEAARSGFLNRDPTGNYAFHPLLRSFFNAKLLADTDRHARATRAARLLLDHSLWEDAFDVIRLFRLDDLLTELFGGLNDMLESGRLATVERWIEHSIEAGKHFPLLDLAEAEVARRQGRFATGEMLALHAASQLHETRFASRAYAIAGECLYYDGRRFEQSLEHLERAEALAETPEDVQRALWGQLLTAAEIKGADLPSLVDRLAAGRNGDANLELRVAGGRAVAAVFTGRVMDAAIEAEQAMDVIARSTDPLAKTFYLYELAYVSVLATRYRRAQEFARIALTEVDRLRLEFARAHVLSVAAFAQIGARHLKRAQLAIKVAADAAREAHDKFATVNVRVLAARMELARSRPDLAAAFLEGNDVDGVHPGLRGEYRALKALVGAIMGERRPALRLAAQAEADTSEVQTRCLAALARAIARPSRSALHAAVRTLEETQAFDSLVCAYRGRPQTLIDLAPFVTSLDLPMVLAHARDYKIAADAGFLFGDRETSPSPFDLLTRREREVLALICEGLTNDEVASRLYLSPATVKLHLRHTFAKLRVRSRTEAVLLASRERDQ